jgi:glycosyltransferase involved in cell wall biosynthesis
MTEAAQAGWVVDPENPELLAKTIESVIRQPEEAARRSRAGRRWVEKEFVRDALARRMLGFMEGILRSRQ